MINRSIIEALMISTSRQQDISFISEEKVLQTFSKSNAFRGCRYK